MIKKVSLFTLKCAQTFLFKSKCKFCKSGPRYVYIMMKKNHTQDSFLKYRDYFIDDYQIFSDNVYLESAIKNRRFRISYLSDYNTMAFKKVSPVNSKYELNKDLFTTIIECECGETMWEYVDSNRAHIKNRKNNNIAPIKDISSIYKFYK